MRPKSESNDSSPLRSLAGYVFNRYLLVTLVVFLVISVPATIYIANVVANLFIQSFESSSVASAEAAMETATQGKSINEPISGDELTNFNTYIAKLKEHTDFKEIKIWAVDGTLVYSSDPKQPLGGKRKIAGNFAKALKNQRASEIEYGVDDPEIPGGRKHVDALEVYFPIHEKEGKNITNIFEIYAPLHTIQNTVNIARASLVGFFILLFVAVAAIGETGAALLTRKNRRLQLLTKELEKLADTDGLTGAYNHRFFRDILRRELNRSKRLNKNLSLIMSDLDYFKSINDFFGHQTGDVVLKKIAETFEDNVRDMDIVARYGGEEFVVVLPESDARKAMEVGERLRKKVDDLEIHVGQEKISLTASFGVADYPSCSDSEDGMVAAADSALLMAKGSGKNEVRYFKNLEDISVESGDIEKLFNRLRYANLLTLQALAAAVKGRDMCELEVSDQAVTLVNKIADKLSLGKHDIDTLATAISLYDIGNIAIPSDILAKAPPLNERDLKLIREHPEAGERILQAVDGLETVLDVVRYHHESYDGTGYPSGLKGEKIPYLARVLHVLDAYFAMISDRPYRKALSKMDAVRELKKEAGTQFDPEVVTHVINALDL